VVSFQLLARKKFGKYPAAALHPFLPFTFPPFNRQYHAASALLLNEKYIQNSKISVQHSNYPATASAVQRVRDARRVRTDYKAVRAGKVK
jgi:hypothetical protein